MMGGVPAPVTCCEARRVGRLRESRSLPVLVRAGWADVHVQVQYRTAPCVVVVAAVLCSYRVQFSIWVSLQRLGRLHTAISCRFGFGFGSVHVA